MAQNKKQNIIQTNNKVAKPKIASKKRNSRGTAPKRKPLFDKRSSQALEEQLLGYLEDYIYKNDGHFPPWYHPPQLDENGDMYRIAEKTQREKTQREYMEHARNDFKDDKCDDRRKQQLLVIARDKKKEAEGAEAYKTFTQSEGQSEADPFCLGHGKWTVYSSVYAEYCWVDRAYSDLQSILFITMNPQKLKRDSETPRPPPRRAPNVGPNDYMAIMTLLPKTVYFDMFTAPTSSSESWYPVKARPEYERQVTIKFQFYHQNYLKFLVPRYILFRHSLPPKTAPTFFEFTAVREGSDNTLPTQNQSEQSDPKVQDNQSKNDGIPKVRSSTRHTRSHNVNQV
ncbi:hypothetical protein N7493_000567 [Penicillium malachiteum]|uniref:Uncharacterized protein n=1 Tax=Penicillium malachiteum TaxID=1324776 RepID=A0AAD6N1J5_9EURO|nr:hypothetical protein N7493_000567 [Penicillium malachiteum]